MIHQDSTQRKILHVLKENAGKHVSGNLLANRFGLSRTGIWKHIQHLKSLATRFRRIPGKDTN